MKYFFTCGMLFLYINLQAQLDSGRHDFFEVGYVTGTFGTEEIPVDDWSRAYEKLTGLSFNGVGLRYGKSLIPSLHLVLGVDYMRREVIYVSDFEVNIKNGVMTYATYPIKTHIFMLQLGTQVAIFKSDKIDVSIFAGGFVHRPHRPKELTLFGINTKAIAGYNFNKKVQLNLKYGYEWAKGLVRRTSLPLELAFHYKIY